MKPDSVLLALLMCPFMLAPGYADAGPPTSGTQQSTATVKITVTVPERVQLRATSRSLGLCLDLKNAHRYSVLATGNGDLPVLRSDHCGSNSRVRVERQSDVTLPSGVVMLMVVPD